MAKKFVYIPSLSSGAIAGGLQKNLKFADGTPYRFYGEEIDPKFKWPAFLITAGHYYKKENAAEDFGLDKKKMIIMGDSGGYQIASGAIKWDLSIRETIFKWLEKNSNVAMNLDIPPRLNYEGQYQECMQISYDNFKYFADNQTGATNFLTVLQGGAPEQYKKWYDKMKVFPFQGWAIGGGAGNVYRLMSGITALLAGKEHLKKTNKYFHILGTSKISDLYILAQLQKVVNKYNDNLTITTDSSTPSRITIFGNLYVGFSYENWAYKTLSYLKSAKYPENYEGEKLLRCTEYDDTLFKNISFKDIAEWTNVGYCAGALHNLYFILDVYNKVNDVVNGGQHTLKQMVSNDQYMLLQSIEELAEADDAWKVFEKYKPLYKKMGSESAQDNNFHDFFEF